MATFFCFALVRHELRTDTRVLTETADTFFDNVALNQSSATASPPSRRIPRVDAAPSARTIAQTDRSPRAARSPSADESGLLAELVLADGQTRTSRIDLATLLAHARGRTSESGHAVWLTWHREPGGLRMLAGDAHLPQTALGLFRIEQASLRHPFSVSAAVGWAGVWRRLVAFLPALVLGAIGAGLAGHLIQTRRQRRFDAPAEQLRRALAQGEFEGHLQPIIDLNTGECAGAEMLMRWRHPSQGLLAPAQFLKEAQASNLLWPMTQACFREVASRLDACDSLPDGFMLCVNVGSSQLLVETDSQPFETLARPGGRRWYTVLELSESEARDPAMTNRLTAFQDRGFLIAVDDFGSAHSGARWIERQSVDLVKIDTRIVATIGTDSVTRPVLDAIVSMARETGVRLIAEGVETASQRAQLRRLGVAYAQGYAFAPPLPADIFVADWLVDVASDEDPSVPARSAYAAPLRVLRA